MQARTSNYIICSNGADIYDLKNNNNIYSTYLNNDLIYNIWKEYNQNFNIILSKGNSECANRKSVYNENPVIINDMNIKDSFYQCHISQKQIDINDNIINELNDLKNKTLDWEKYIDFELINHLFSSNYLNQKEIEILIRLKRFLELKKVKEEILNKYSRLVSLANQSADFTKFKYNGEIPWFTINDNKVSKGYGIVKICEFLNIDYNQRLAIGNDYNDNSMIDSSKYFACPSDSCDVLLKRSKFIYNREDGVDKILRKVIE